MDGVKGGAKLFTLTSSCMLFLSKEKATIAKPFLQPCAFVYGSISAVYCRFSGRVMAPNEPPILTRQWIAIFTAGLVLTPEVSSKHDKKVNISKN